MITLKQMVQSDTALAAVTAEECQLIAAVLEVVTRSWAARRFLPKEHRDKVLSFRMLAATLAKVPPPKPGSFAKQVALSLGRGKSPRDEWAKDEIEGKYEPKHYMNGEKVK